MVIYKVTNTQTKKCYIGQTTRPLSHRKSSHYTPEELNDGSYFHNSLIKYSKELWIWEVIDTVNTINELNLNEQYWIGFYKSNIRENGYNLSSGGLNSIRNEESRKKTSNSLKGRKFSEEHKLHIKEKRQYQVCTDETRKKMSIVRIGKKHWHYNKSDYIYNFISPKPEYIRYKNITNLKEFCIEHKLSYECVQSRFNQNKDTHKDWQIFRIKKSDIYSSPTQIKESTNEQRIAA